MHQHEAAESLGFEIGANVMTFAPILTDRPASQNSATRLIMRGLFSGDCFENRGDDFQGEPVAQIELSQNRSFSR